MGLIMAYLPSGRDSDAIEPARHLALIEPALSEPLDRWNQLQGLIENAQANDRGSVPGLVERLTKQSSQIGAPSLLADTARYRALSALYAQDPRDPKGAFTAAHEA
jgi:hypothetical protein